ncbi:MAG: YesL family protein [Clostridia bacterium]|nr:YesL family protein [Clostridia bacterium]
MRFLMKLFSEESAFGRFLNRLYVLITANLLFVLFSLPVVTIGASLTALNYTMMKLQRGDKHFKVAATFWKGFRENWKKSTLAFLILGALVLFQLLEISWCRQFQGAVAAFEYVLVGLLVLEGMLAIYLFPVIAAFNGGLGELLRDAMYFAFAKPHWLVVNLALYVLPLWGTYAALTYLPLWAFLWLMIGFGLIVYLSTHLMLKIFTPFLPEVDICGDVIPPGMEDDPNIMVADGKAEDDDPDEKTLREMMKYGL